MNLNRQQVAPLKVARSNRVQQTRALTSLPAGKVVPLAAIPMLREDSLSGRYRCSFEMHETVEILMNAVNVKVCAYLVPWLAYPQFEGSMDQLNKSYKGEPKAVGAGVVSFFNTSAAPAFASTWAIHKYLGLHSKQGDTINRTYIRAYNLIWNHRAVNRSKEITALSIDNTSLAPAFWQHDQFGHILPDFDQAVIDGEISLNIVEGGLTSSAPVTGIAAQYTSYTTAATGYKDSAGGDPPAGSNWSPPIDNAAFQVRIQGDDTTEFPNIRADLTNLIAEMSASGITVSLANLELAKKTQAFAKLREQYEGHTEEWLIGLLMDGITIPDQALKEPILLAEAMSRFGQAKRYASDAANLTDSVVNGAAQVEFSINVPRLTTGGIVMITAEIVPEQLFERQRDPMLYTTTVDTLPAYLRDTLDPEKVEVVLNGRIDTEHTAPNDVFGYEPLNARWNIVQPRIGGRFFRPTDTSADEARQRIWAVEVADPVLSEDFMIATTMNQKPFFVTNVDPFECVTVGQAVINGNTVFGHILSEDTGNYDAVLADAPQERIDQSDDPTN